ncbi:hypothetical protein LO772_27880 [Yinghuangia sp. ASG 101]|uniref:hypothetical protein n=1 Tax=Yinghuangia sp. ASG 101 TaxID=2896848 RepID=UPI001E3833AF|nr:hypothetical protein [Yinghuangia sp. ASG 101]UGQ10625.1 hypothetical protein LO772_27880 [Yinghuangia sp. ASG 101]
MKFTRTRALVAALVPLAAIAAFAAPSATADTTAAPAPKIIVTPNYGAADGGTAVAKTNVPCPDGSTSFRFMLSGPNVPGYVFGSSRLGTPLPADGIPDTSVIGARLLFPAGTLPVNGASYALDAQCLDAARNATTLASTTVKVNEGVWNTLAPVVYALPAKIGSLRVSLVAFTGFAGGEGVTGTLRAADGTNVPVTLQPQGTDAQGRGAALLQVPASVADGSYTLVVTGAASKAVGEIAVTLDTTRVWW